MKVRQEGLYIIISLICYVLFLSPVEVNLHVDDKNKAIIVIKQKTSTVWRYGVNVSS